MIDPEKFLEEFQAYLDYFGELVVSQPHVARETVLKHAEDLPICLSGTLPCVKTRLWARHRAAQTLLPKLID